MSRAVLFLCRCVHVVPGLYQSLTLSLTLILTRALDQNVPKWQKIYMRALVHVQFLKHFNNYFHFLFFWVKNVLVIMGAKFWENMLTGFWFMDLALNWYNPGRFIHKRLEYNRVEMPLKVIDCLRYQKRVLGNA